MDSDYLVIGSGIAGLSFALRVADKHTVTVITKKKDKDTATNLAQGGIAAVLGAEDSIDNHVNDTITAGDGLCDRSVVEMVVASGQARIQDLMNYGVDFVRDKDDDTLSLGREGGHSHRRVAHAYDLTGREIERALLVNIKKHKNINILEEHMVLDLLLGGASEDRKCCGVRVLDSVGESKQCYARRTVLCTGGSGKVYLYTSNPDIATGDGVAIAFRAGAKIANMEFVQFHPTCLYHPRAKNFLISEALRGEGGRLYNESGTRFMDKYDSRKELATRDMVARSIDQEMKERGHDCVYLDISHKKKEFLTKRFPGIFEKCREYGIDISQQAIPVVPAAHYQCGGVLVDAWGNTSISGLMALGETACTGLHGANRLASNSLLEAVVYAERAADYCLTNPHLITERERELGMSEEKSHGTAELDEEILINHNWDVIRRTMWDYVGIVRTTKRLQMAKRRLLQINHDIEDLYQNYAVSKNMAELRNISHLSLMIVESALQRKESRGLHYCVDYPSKSNDFLNWTVLKKPQSSDSDYASLCLERQNFHW